MVKYEFGKGDRVKVMGYDGVVIKQRGWFKPKYSVGVKHIVTGNAMILKVEENQLEKVTKEEFKEAQ